jgi:Fur family ferric uptake transcriptional regulator
VYNSVSAGLTIMEREEVQLFHEHLKRARLKRTSQRDLILDIFLDTEGHVSSEDLYSIVKAKDPSVGFTTVYRTLKLLKECGLARELEFHDGRTLYEHEYKHKHHDHLICTQCGALIEFYNEEIEQLQDEIVRRYKFKPLHHSHRIFGICADCQKAQKTLERANASGK